MRINCRDGATLSHRALHDLRRRVDRETTSATDIVHPDDYAPDLARYTPGNTFGMYGETINRLEVRRHGIPDWFDPITKQGQHGIIDGPFRIYFQLTLNEVERNAPSTFDALIVPLAEPNPEQIALL